MRNRIHNLRSGCPLACVAALLLSLAHVPVQAEELDWEFRVLLDDKEIGSHRFTVTDAGDERILNTEAKFDVRFLFLTAFRYRHQNTEVWDDGCLESIDATTDNNGDELVVRGDREEDAFRLDKSPDGEKTLPECVRSFAYWNPRVLDADRLLNSQTGEYEEVSVTLEGEDRVRVGERKVDALRYRLSARKGDITLWYSAADRVWLALEAPAKGGRTIRYEPVAVPEAPAVQRLARND